MRKQILRELQIMYDCHSEYIVSFYGAFLSDPNICICMEHIDKGSLDGIYKKIGPIDIDVVGKVALAVLEGLTYLYDVHRIIHRGTCCSLFTIGYRPLIKLSQISNRPICCSIQRDKLRYATLEFLENSSIPSPTHLSGLLLI